jgi:hypothetical protein
MKTRLMRLAGLFLALVVAIAGIGVAAAQDNAERAEADLVVRVLAVGAPNVVEVGEEVTITITERYSGAVVEGAYVYALSWPVTAAARMVDAAVLDCPTSYKCEFLGRSDGDGKLTYAFENAGRLLLAATRDGYGPGLSKLIVKPHIMNRMTIEAPRRAEVDQPVKMKVVDRNDGQGVPQADIWAIDWPMRLIKDDKAASINDAKAMLEELRAGDSNVLRDFGAEHLGQTGDDGVLTPTFSETGSYWLIATKSEYVPAVKSITIVTNRALEIRSPQSADPGEDVTFQVLTRGLGDPVEGAALYAVRLPCESLDSVVPPFSDADNGALRAMAADCGHYLGDTDENGKLTHAFADEGRYSIFALEDGYVPGVTSLKVGDPTDGPVLERASLADSLRELMPYNRILKRLRSNVKNGDSLQTDCGGTAAGLQRVAPMAEPFDGVRVLQYQVDENDEM